MTWKCRKYDSEYREISNSLSGTYYVLGTLANVWKLLMRTLILTAIVSCRLRIVGSLHTITRKYSGFIDDVLLYLPRLQKEYNLLTEAINLSSEGMKRAKISQSCWFVGQLASARHGWPAAQAELSRTGPLYGKSSVSVLFMRYQSWGKWNGLSLHINHPGEDLNPLVKVASPVGSQMSCSC